MLKILRGGQRWLTALFVAAIGGVFVFFLGLQGPLDLAGGGTLVRVGDHSFGVREFDRARQSRVLRLQQELGDQANLDQFADTLDQLAARELVDRALLSIEAEALGLSVSKQEIEALVLEDPGFRDEGGRFDEEQFKAFADYEFGSQRAFIADRRMALLSYKMIRLLNTTPRVSDGEARDAVARDLERIRIAFVALGGDIVEPGSVTFSEEDVADVLASRDEELRALYAERSAEFNAPEQVRARHILFSLPSDATVARQEEIRSLAQSTLERILSGESFEALAEEFSEDPGSKNKGGDLGFFGRGQMVPEFEQAAFAMQPGDVSELVKSSFGLHIIRTEERKEAKEQSFEVVREEIARDVLERESRLGDARATASELASAVEGGQSLEDAARAKELTLERTAPIGRRPDGFVPGLGAAQDLLDTAFSLQAGESSPRIFETGDQIAMVQVLERVDPNPQEIAAAVEEKRQQLLAAKRNARASGWLEERRAELVESGSLMVNLASLTGR